MSGRWGRIGERSDLKLVGPIYSIRTRGQTIMSGIQMQDVVDGLRGPCDCGVARRPIAIDGLHKRIQKSWHRRDCQSVPGPTQTNGGLVGISKRVYVVEMRNTAQLSGPMRSYYSWALATTPPAIYRLCPGWLARDRTMEYSISMSWV